MRLAQVTLIWAALAAAICMPIAAAAASPLLAWRDPVYILAGFAGIVALGLMLVGGSVLATGFSGLLLPARAFAVPVLIAGGVRPSGRRRAERAFRDGKLSGIEAIRIFGTCSELGQTGRVADVPDRQVRATKRHRTALIAQRPTLDEFGTKTPELVVCDRPRFL